MSAGAEGLGFGESHHLHHLKPGNIQFKHKTKEIWIIFTKSNTIILLAMKTSTNADILELTERN